MVRNSCKCITSFNFPVQIIIGATLQRKLFLNIGIVLNYFLKHKLTKFKLSYFPAKDEEDNNDF